MQIFKTLVAALIFSIVVVAQQQPRSEDASSDVLRPTARSITVAVLDFGASNLARSSLLKRLNSGDYAGVPEELRRWSSPSSAGVSYPSMQVRRDAEAELWNTPTAAKK